MDSMLQTTLRDEVATIWLNRPELRNALNAQLIDALHDAVARAIEARDARVIVLAGRGPAFCAGADLNWMKQAAGYGREENEADALRLAQLLRALYESPKPTVARVHGAAFAGAMGLVAACDIAVASTAAKFCLSEVKLGLIPAMISPYVIRAIGERAARRYFLTAEVFDAGEAYRLGFVQALAQPDTLDATLDAVVAQLLQAGPGALAEAKRLIRDVAGRDIDDALTTDTAARIAAVRASAEGREGIASFLEKRKPSWQSPR
ncbi:MAG TPA: enoyl-CoA hydratase/isomerase family protein [Burkholderiaceae bacterium]|nr:enoyl-CoA hydratase/isomerase family protein [Burkholderiaceae bacterium]